MLTPVTTLDALKALAVGDRVSFTDRSGLRAERAEGVVSFVGALDFHASRLDWSRRLCVRGEGRRTWTAETADLSDLCAESVDPQRGALYLSAAMPNMQSHLEFLQVERRFVAKQVDAAPRAQDGKRLPAHRALVGVLRGRRQNELRAARGRE